MSKRKINICLFCGCSQELGKEKCENCEKENLYELEAETTTILLCEFDRRLKVLESGLHEYLNKEIKKLILGCDQSKTIVDLRERVETLEKQVACTHKGKNETIVCHNCGLNCDDKEDK